MVFGYGRNAVTLLVEVLQVRRLDLDKLSMLVARQLAVFHIVGGGHPECRRLPKNAYFGILNVRPI